MTNYEKIQLMSVEEMATAILNDELFGCNFCPEEERLSDNPLTKFEKCNMQCKMYCIEWLNKEAE